MCTQLSVLNAQLTTRVPPHIHVVTTGVGILCTVVVYDTIIGGSWEKGTQEFLSIFTTFVSLKLFQNKILLKVYY